MTDPYPSRTADKIVVRLPDGMRDRLAELAKANNRSVNAEVVARLTLALEMGWPSGISDQKRLEYLEEAIKSLQQTTEDFRSFVKSSTSK